MTILVLYDGGGIYALEVPEDVDISRLWEYAQEREEK
jgi:hypothetical protein